MTERKERKEIIKQYIHIIHDFIYIERETGKRTHIIKQVVKVNR